MRAPRRRPHPAAPRPPRLDPPGAFLGVFCASLLGLALWAAAAASPASAHAVYVFAWAEGDRICASGYFSGKSPVRGGKLTVATAGGTVVATGATDDEGGICLPRPQAEGDLTFDLMAGEGHRAGFTLRAEDMPPPAPSVGPPPPAAAAEAAAPGAPAPASPASSQAGPAPGLEEIRLAVRDELSAQLGPLSRRLAESGSEPPSFREVIGGLGWLAGIFGFAFYWSARHPRAKPPAPRFASRV